MKVVLDTNVLLSGLMFPEGTPGRIVRAWAEARFGVALSLDQLAEIGRVLEYPKIRRRLGWDDQQIETFIKQLYVRAEVIELGPLSVEVPRDADDAPILATLAAAKADVLVTGDGDLLALRDKYPIETPADFVRRL
ncbi:MAG: putative toxin-antitoxin system toxin component, PIN family [Betaproteobacteria bacterium]|nr:putative toxin-antitoxin system toxin component, PIN family [Betaproteobacteria bacterium]